MENVSEQHKTACRLVNRNKMRKTKIISSNLAGNNNNNKSNNKSHSSVVTSSATSSSTSTSNRTGPSCWEGPPAHFMLPTHAIHCRSSQSIERCPRACKGNSFSIIYLSIFKQRFYSLFFVYAIRGFTIF